MSDGFWDKVRAQTEELRSAKSADEVLAILSPARNPYGPEWGGNTWEGFFVSGLEDTMWDALKAAGWKRVWAESSIYYVAKAPNGDLVTYCEGDVGRGDKRVNAAPVTAEHVDGQFSPTDLANPYNAEAQKAKTEREAYVTDQVSLWIQNDGEYHADAFRLAAVNDVPALRRYLMRTIRWARSDQAAWHVNQELAPNDWDRVDWALIAEALRGE